MVLRLTLRPNPGAGPTARGAGRCAVPPMLHFDVTGAVHVAGRRRDNLGHFPAS